MTNMSSNNNNIYTVTVFCAFLKALSRSRQVIARKVVFYDRKECVCAHTIPSNKDFVVKKNVEEEADFNFSLI